MKRHYLKNWNSGVDWIGQVPEDWDVLQSRRLFADVSEAAQNGDEQLSVTQKAGVIPQRLYIEQEEQNVVRALAGLANFKHVESGDFVISLRSFQGGIEYCAYRGCVSPAYTVLRNRKGIYHAFFKYALKSDGFISKLQSVTTGIRDGRNVSYEQFGIVNLPVPTISEQRDIANYLNRETAKVDALVEEQQRLIELLKEKRQAVITRAVTKGLNPSAPMKPSGVEWLGDIPAHWAAKRLRHISPGITVGIVIEPSKYYVDEGGIAALRSLNVRPGSISLQNTVQISRDGHAKNSKSQLYAGDIVAVRTGQPGTAAVIPPELDGINCIDLIIIRMS
jgi:type I restriction enzyme, S subunit